tara:strand:+ start:475 stop:768 length:294 start_codon:yes stop_codon:yes gene_type:complete
MMEVQVVLGKIIVVFLVQMLEPVGGLLVVEVVVLIKELRRLVLGLVVQVVAEQVETSHFKVLLAQVMVLITQVVEVAALVATLLKRLIAVEQGVMAS